MRLLWRTSLRFSMCYSIFSEIIYWFMIWWQYIWEAVSSQSTNILRQPWKLSPELSCSILSSQIALFIVTLSSLAMPTEIWGDAEDHPSSWHMGSDRLRNVVFYKIVHFLWRGTKWRGKEKRDLTPLLCVKEKNTSNVAKDFVIMYVNIPLKVLSLEDIKALK